MMKMASAGVVVLMAVACGGPEHEGAAVEQQEQTQPRQERVIEREARRDVFADRQPDLPYLVSRFAPQRGVPGTHITLLVAFDAAGCAAAGTCAVTMGGQDVEIVDDTGVLVVSVPRWSVTGTLCVRWHERWECVGRFEVMDAALIHGAHVSGETVVLHGEGFTTESLVVLDYNPLETTLLPHGELRAVLPAQNRDHGTPLELRVYSPTSGRCGTYSEPVTVTVQ